MTHKNIQGPFPEMKLNKVPKDSPLLTDAGAVLPVEIGYYTFNDQMKITKIEYKGELDMTWEGRTLFFLIFYKFRIISKKKKQSFCSQNVRKINSKSKDNHKFCTKNKASRKRPSTRPRWANTNTAWDLQFSMRWLAKWMNLPQLWPKRNRIGLKFG